MKVIQVISEWKRKPKQGHPIAKGKKRVQAIVSFGGEHVTRHIDVPR